MINILNNLNDFSKCIIIVLSVAFVILMALVIYLVIKTRKVKDIEIDDKFLENAKKEINTTKNIFEDNKEIKASDIAVKIEPKEEVESIKQIEEKDTKPTKFDIGEVAKQMEEDINNNLELTEFEMEQEEKSIISYEELLKKVKQNTTDSNCKVNVQTVELNEEKPKTEEEFNYNTEILDFSDINEVATENTTTLLKQDDLKEMLNISDIDAAIYTSDDFLSALKELRDNLE